MGILILFLFAVAAYNLKLSPFHKDYMDKTSADAVKGFFAVVILYSHMGKYLSFSNSFIDILFEGFLTYLGQLMVVMYFFYSGYGLMESLRNKPNYQKTFFKSRFLKILLHFDIAVVLYILLQSILGVQFATHIYIMSLIGWESVGNSNWFIFDILIFYIFFWLAVTCSNIVKIKFLSKYVIVFTIVAVLCVFLWFFLFVSKGQKWWVDSIFTFPLGIAYSLLKEEIDIIMNKTSVYYSVILGGITLFVIWHYYQNVDVLGISSCLFALIVAFLSMKMKIGNVILLWLGKQAFAIYILQRLPMIILCHWGLNNYKFLFVSITLLSVFIMASVFTIFLNKIDNSLFRIRNCR